MSPKKPGGYPYSLDDSITRSRKKGKQSRFLSALLWILLLVVTAAGVLFFLNPTLLSAVSSYLPFPKELVAIRLLHNGKEVILLPNSQCVVNPRDSLQLLQVKTDGWVSWGTKVTASEIDARALRTQPRVFRELMPNESFETPKTIELRVLLWNRPIGKVSFLVQLDAKDWLQKANTTEDMERKIFYLEKALQENTGNVLVKTQLATLYFDSKRYDEAAQLYKEINEVGKTKTVLERLLTIYQIQKRVDDALMTYLELLRLSEDRELFKEFVDYLQKNKSKEEAGRFLEKHQHEVPKAFHSSLLLVLAELNTQARNWAKAAATYEKAIKSGVEDPDVYYNLAVTYQHGEDMDKAIHALERYLHKNPSDIRSWMQLGELQEKRKDFASARRTYQAVLQKNPGNKEALLRMAAVLEKMNDKGALQDIYEKLLAAQPKNKTLLYNLGVLYYESKKWDKATEAFAKMAAMDPRDLESRKYLLDLYRKQKNTKGEMEILAQLAHLDPGNSATLDSLFKAYDSRKDYKGMVEFFRGLEEKRQDSVQLHNYLLYGLLKTGDTKGALKQLDHLIRLQPREKKHLRQAARLYESTGNTAEALKKLDQLLKLDPRDEQAKEDYLRLRMQGLSKKKQQ
ncbi:MAG: tetratricopeptide repeat protein [Syntrophobacteraceae bacterium]|nr:tetratricopeptide repeat protein [Syntrophobacteraceae bacterium]